MQYKIIFLVVLLFNSTGVLFGATTWTQLGNELNQNSSLRGFNPTCAEVNGELYAAWEEDRGDDKNLVWVKKWNGSQWDTVGNSLNGTVSGNAPHIVADGTTPYVTWHEEGKIYVKYYNGTDWQGLNNNSGPLNINNNAATGFSWLTIVDHKPVVSWTEQSSEPSGIYRGYIKKWNGTTWDLLRNGSNDYINLATDHGVYSARVEADNGSVYVTWVEETVTNNNIWHVYVARHTGSNWEQLGTGSLNITPDVECGGPVLRFDSQHTPYVAFQDGSFGQISQIRVKYWSGSNWLSLGASLNYQTSVSARHCNMWMINDVSYVTWYESSNIYVKHWNGLAWEQDGSALDVVSSAWAAHGYITKYDNQASVVWMEGFPYKIYVKKTDALQLPATRTVTPTVTVTPTATLTVTISATSTASVSATPTLTMTMKWNDGGYIEPNPFFPTSGQTAKIYLGNEITQNHYEIKFYDLNGKFIRRLINSDVWDGKNDQGHFCEGGVYIFQVEGNGTRLTGQVVLLK